MSCMKRSWSNMMFGHGSISNITVTNADLNRYYNDQVTMRRKDTEESISIVMPIISDILAYIHNELDPRFSRQRKNVGSYWQGLKVDRADEFDINVPLCQLDGDKMPWVLSGTPWGQERIRYYRFDRPQNDPLETLPENLNIVNTGIALPSPPAGQVFISIFEPTDPVRQEHRDLFFDDDLVPFLVKRRFKQLLASAIQALGLQDCVHRSRKVHGPALTISVEVNGHYPISVDFAPVILSRLPFPDWITWPRRGTSWPSRDKIAAIQQIGINNVAKKEFYWQLSFAQAETELMQGIDEDQGCRKKSHRIMKKLREDVWCKTSSKPVLSSYHLKNVLLWECETFPNDFDWTQDKLAERFISMINRLLRCIRQRQLPVYFHPDVNLLENKDEAELDEVVRKINEFMQNPQGYM